MAATWLQQILRKLKWQTNIQNTPKKEQGNNKRNILYTMYIELYVYIKHNLCYCLTLSLFVPYKLKLN